jgi:predicted nucleic acid-binding protein
MITAPIVCVVDASVGIKLVITEPDYAQALALFAHAIQDPNARFFVPALFYLECANILRTAVKRGLITSGDAPSKLATLRGFPLQQAASLLDDALNLALAHDLCVYDAVYVAASIALQVPLITADDKLVRKMAATPYTVDLLGGLSIPLPPSLPTP